MRLLSSSICCWCLQRPWWPVGCVLWSLLFFQNTSEAGGSAWWQLNSMQAMRLHLQAVHVAHVSTCPDVTDARHSTHLWSTCYAAAVQMTTAFGEQGLLSHDHKMVYADTGRLAKVTAPALFLVGDRDRMCPPEGCRRTYQVGRCAWKRFHGLGFCGTHKPKTLC